MAVTGVVRKRSLWIFSSRFSKISRSSIGNPGTRDVSPFIVVHKFTSKAKGVGVSGRALDTATNRGRRSPANRCLPCLYNHMSSALKKQRLDAVNADDIPPAAAMPEPAEAMEEDSRLALLRAKMRHHDVSAYLIETQDAHQSEYVADHDKRREWLTGFTGSAGSALVTSTSALMWTDGRYFLQVCGKKGSGSGPRVLCMGHDHKQQSVARCRLQMAGIVMVAVAVTGGG